MRRKNGKTIIHTCMMKLIFFTQTLLSRRGTVPRRLSTFILKTVNLTKRNREKTSQKRPFLAKISDLNTGICGLGRHHPRPFRRPKVMPSRSSHPGDMWGGAGGFGPVKSTSRGRPEPSKWAKKIVENLALRCSLRQPCGKFAG